MAKIRTHYDNLKVARDAPAEVIRAAYKTLSQRFHPDRNPGNADAARVMTIINTSYAVLSDPDRRREHDGWIKAMEERAGDGHGAPPPRPQPPRQPADSPQPHAGGEFDISSLIRFVLIASVIGAVFWLWVKDPSSPPPGPKPYEPDPVAAQSSSLPVKATQPTVYQRPTTAPNGRPWPTSAGYVAGYERLNRSGLSTVTVDNSQNDADVFVKLVTLDAPQAFPVRQFFIPAYSRFSAKNVTAGNYDIRYRDLDTGGLSRSEPFTVEQTGQQYSEITTTLYKVQNGNMQTYGLAEAEF